MLKKTILLLGMSAGMSLLGHTQSTTIATDDPQSYLWQRLDIKQPNDSILRFTTWRSYDRQLATEAWKVLDSLQKQGQLPAQTSVDAYNLQRAIALNTFSLPSKGDFLHVPTHLIATESRQFGILVDPKLQYAWGNSSDKNNLFTQSVGVDIKGHLGKKVGFYFSYTYNRERDPQYVQDFVNAREGLPGAQTYRVKGTGKNIFEYNDFRGGVAWNITKHVDAKIGYDQFFIGEGIRSLYLSDFSAPFYFVQLHAKVGNFNYTTVASRTITSFGAIQNNLTDRGRPGNLLVFHYGSWQANRWLNLGVFENNMYNLEYNGGIQPGMLNPFIFNRGMSQNVGNSGKSSIGLDAKANIAKKVQVYSQILINEFVLSHVLDYGKGSWRNKHGLQFGAKYMDAFQVQNLDLQVEYNVVRPFTYTDKWVVNNFAHDNLPLAHPLGANFKEYIGVAHYQPIPRLQLTGTVILYKKGLDSASYKTAAMQQNFGGDIFRGYLDQNSFQDVAIGDGIPVNGLVGQLQATYEVAPNLFLDGNVTLRRYDISRQPKDHIHYFNIGFRWNMSGRKFLF